MTIGPIRIVNNCFLLSFLFLLATNQTAIGQPRPQRPPGGDPEAAAACATCCGGTVLMIVVPIVTAVVVLAINIAILFWVAKDAKSRGMDGAMWIFLVLFTGVLGLAIYLFSRPQGMLVQCDNCGNNKLEASVKCPHCSFKTASQSGRSSSGRKSRRRDDDDDDDD